MFKQYNSTHILQERNKTPSHSLKSVLIHYLCGLCLSLWSLFALLCTLCLILIVYRYSQANPDEVTWLNKPIVSTLNVKTNSSEPIQKRSIIHTSSSPPSSNPNRTSQTPTLTKLTKTQLNTKSNSSKPIKNNQERSIINSSSSSPTLNSKRSSQSSSLNKVAKSQENIRCMYSWNMTRNEFVCVNTVLDPNAEFLKPNFQQILFTPVTANNPLLDESQAGQVTILSELLNNKTNGFFIDLATNHYRHHSNSFGLERRYNWSGICIEPVNTYFKDILESRRCVLVNNPVFSSSNKLVLFHVQHGGSGIVSDGMDNQNAKSNNIELPTVTLMDILRRFKPMNIPHIDYLSLDVEGGEFEVLVNHDFQSFPIKIMTIERPKDKLHAHLIKNGYWWLTHLYDFKIPGRLFGDMVYIHYTLENFDYFMNKYRRGINPQTKFRTGRRDYNMDYMNRPPWPIHSENGAIKYNISSNDFFHDDALLHCGGKNVFMMRQHLRHLVTSNAVMVAMNREWSETRSITPEFCSKFQQGVDLTIENYRLPMNDSIWARPK